jgi:hypothetical protein
MREVRELLRTAAEIYDEPSHGLRQASRAALWTGFGGGAAWMRSAMGVVRGNAPIGRASPEWLGACKYALAGVAALIAWALLWRLPVLAAIAAILAFYSVEGHMVFVFPLALDGEPAPIVASHRLVARTLPPERAMARVMRIAATMLFGGFMGQGFVRSWCLGCLAVVLWYEDARHAVALQP